LFGGERGLVVDGGPGTGVAVEFNVGGVFLREFQITKLTIVQHPLILYNKLVVKERKKGASR
jgi:hypothetical protein